MLGPRDHCHGTPPPPPTSQVTFSFSPLGRAPRSPRLWFVCFSAADCLSAVTCLKLLAGTGMGASSGERHLLPERCRLPHTILLAGAGAPRMAWGQAPPLRALAGTGPLLTRHPPHAMHPAPAIGMRQVVGLGQQPELSRRHARPSLSKRFEAGGGAQVEAAAQGREGKKKKTRPRRGEEEKTSAAWEGGGKKAQQGKECPCRVLKAVAAWEGGDTVRLHWSLRPKAKPENFQGSRHHHHPLAMKSLAKRKSVVTLSYPHKTCCNASRVELCCNVTPHSTETS